MGLIRRYKDVKTQLKASNIVTTAGVSGAVALDCSLGSVFFLSLTGNVTSFNITVPPANSGTVEVHFIQDATGSRTLSGVNAAVKLAGGALTLTTTASKRDVLRFRYNGTSTFYETDRSLNL